MTITPVSTTPAPTKGAGSNKGLGQGQGRTEPPGQSNGKKDLTPPATTTVTVTG